MSADPERTLGWILDASHDLPPDEVPDLLAAAAARLGARELRLYLADLAQRRLVPVPGPESDVLDIDGTLAGRAFQTSAVTRTDGEDVVWFPVMSGTARLGVLALAFPHVDDAAEAAGRHLAALAADLVMAKGRCGDIFHDVTRRQPPRLAAELQLQILPPLTFTTRRVSVAGVLEPAYDVAGDSFDYALNGDTLSVAIFDSAGHDLASAVMATVAVGAYRHARRRDLDLPETAAEIDGAVQSQFERSAFVTAALLQLDVPTGAVRWLNAGHPRPLLLRNGQVVHTLACRPRTPLGIAGADPEIGTEQLEPGDALLLFTDGVVEAKAPRGPRFGFERLADFLGRAAAADLAPAETMRRLVGLVVDHHGGRLHDDATCVLVTWQGD